MRILFIRTYDFYEPIGIMILSAILKKHGHYCELLDLKFEKNIIKSIKEIKPNIIAYSIFSNDWEKYVILNKKIKKDYSCFSIFGGPHATFAPEIIEEEGIDAVCVGEGEYAILELANALKNNNDYSKIKNLHIKINGEIFKNEVRELIHDLDSIPFPDRELINKYNHYRKRSRVRTIASRGCPYDCTYCFNHSYKKIYDGKGPFLRIRSPQNVIDELKLLKEQYKPKNCEFHDDTFILNKMWTFEFLELYIKENINIPFEINARVNLITDELVKKLKEAGCYSIQFGIEAGNDIIRNKILKRNITKDQIINAAEIIRKYNIRINAFNLLGLPGETIENAMETINLNIKCKVSYALSTVWQPYPGPELTKYAIDNGYLNTNPDISSSFFYGNSYLKTPNAKKLARLQFLFSYTVKFPFLIPITLILIKLPLRKFYQFFFFIYRAYAVMFIFKRVTLKEAFIVERKKR